MCAASSRDAAAHVSPARDGRRHDHAARRCAAWSFGLALVTVLVITSYVSGCRPAAVVGTYSDAGVRCDPLGSDCGSGTCTLRADPAMDACRSAGTLAERSPCDALDTCVPGAQCATILASSATLDPAWLRTGLCLRICARDAPACEAGERCLGIEASGGGVRVDYGVCAPP